MAKAFWSISVGWSSAQLVHRALLSSLVTTSSRVHSFSALSCHFFHTFCLFLSLSLSLSIFTSHRCNLLFIMYPPIFQASERARSIRSDSNASSKRRLKNILKVPFRHACLKNVFKISFIPFFSHACCLGERFFALRESISFCRTVGLSSFILPPSLSCSHRQLFFCDFLHWLRSSLWRSNATLRMYLPFHKREIHIAFSTSFTNVWLRHPCVAQMI